MTNYFSPIEAEKREKQISSLFGKDILEGESMRRLRGVSFLGALNITAGVPEPWFNRYDHSISVAYLTWQFCQNLQIKEEILLLTTLGALIHDITHPPFSHSTEVYLNVRSGVKTQHTSSLTEKKIVKILREGYNTFPPKLRKIKPEFLANALYKLLNSREARKYYHPYISDIFDSPFCPDTFDGVNRAWYALSSRDVKDRLGTRLTQHLEVINPISLVWFISSTSPYPFVYYSVSPPTNANLVYKFHDRMRALYNSVIYSEWQTSAMVMFARALEIAYQGAKRFALGQNDSDVVNTIKNNPESNKIYNLVFSGCNFYPLSKENPLLYKLALTYYTEAKNRFRLYKERKRAVEAMVAKELKTDKDLVYWYEYQPLIWSPDNIEFRKWGKNESLWRLNWKPSEGEPSKDTEVEIYYTLLS